MTGRVALSATALAVLALSGCERAPKDSATQKVGPACEGIPELDFDSGIADPENLLRGGYEERVRGAQLRFYRARHDRWLPVVILPDLNDHNMNAVARCIAHHWESEGIMTTNDILIVVTSNDRHAHILPGARVRDEISDAEAAKIIEKMASIFAADGPTAGNISEGLSAGIDAINEHLKDRP